MYDKNRYSYKNFIYSSHRVIADILNASKPQSILDVGCAEGLIGRGISFKPKQMIGIDIVKQSGDYPNYTEILRLDIEKEGTKRLENSKFDAIILADVLEHLEDPALVLQKLKTILEDNGYFIISLPNTGILPSRILSFLGIKLRMDRGIFDRTHLHEYTYNQAIKFIENQNLKIAKITVTPSPLPILSSFFNEDKPFYFAYKFANYLARVFPSLFAYQTIIVAKKKVQ
jgi:2-polyprenyl-3-methyl-5-hydroxy-6-metoxy-1,4-benzoquinol methylase